LEWLGAILIPELTRILPLELAVLPLLSALSRLLAHPWALSIILSAPGSGVMRSAATFSRVVLGRNDRRRKAQE
jgi:hypothetical protein